MSDPVVNRGFFGKMMGSSFYKKFILPGLISQSVVIAGGYGTGRELVEYFGNFGSLGGILGMALVTTTLWAVVYAASYEFARTFKVYDYRGFFKELLGPGWMLYEVCYLVLLLIVLGVVGAASGSIFKQAFGLPPLVGAALFLAGVVTLTFFRQLRHRGRPVVVVLRPLPRSSGLPPRGALQGGRPDKREPGFRGHPGRLGPGRFQICRL